MKIIIRFYARFAEKFGKELSMEVENGLNIEHLLEILKIKFGDLRKERNILVSVNDRISEGDRILTEGDIVSIFPPPGGG